MSTNRTARRARWPHGTADAPAKAKLAGNTVLDRRPWVYNRAESPLVKSVGGFLEFLN